MPKPEVRSTAGVVRELQAGINCSENFNLLFQRYYGLLRHYFRQRRCSVEQAEDLTQETYIRVYRNVGGFRHEARFETWLLKIAGSVYSDLAFKASRAPAELDAELARQASHSAAVDPLERVLRRERSNALRTAISEMPRQMRCCVTLRVSRGLRYREIADEMRVSIDVVRVQLFRARRRLQDELGGEIEVTEL